MCVPKETVRAHDPAIAAVSCGMARPNSKIKCV